MFSDFADIRLYPRTRPPSPLFTAYDRREDSLNARLVSVRDIVNARVKGMPALFRTLRAIFFELYPRAIPSPISSVICFAAFGPNSASNRPSGAPSADMPTNAVKASPGMRFQVAPILTIFCLLTPFGSPAHVARSALSSASRTAICWASTILPLADRANP